MATKKKDEAIEGQEEKLEEAAERAQNAAEADADKGSDLADELRAQADRLEEQDETVDPGKAVGKGAGANPKVAGGEDLKTFQIENGDAPIAPGPEKDVDPHDAQQAKENRGA